MVSQNLEELIERMKTLQERFKLEQQLELAKRLVSTKAGK